MVETPIGFPAWHELNETQFDELLRLSRLYYREAHRCRSAKAYLAGCAMSGAALEALLIAMAHLYPADVETIGELPKSKGKTKHVLDWSLGELVPVAIRAGWMPVGLTPDEDWSRSRAKIGDYVRVVHQMRNFLHAGRYLKKHSPRRVTKKYLERSLEIVDVANTYLEARVHESLRHQLEDEDR